MKYFLRLGQGLQVINAMHELQLNPHLWNQNKLRTEHALTPHKEVDDIWLRFNDLEPYKAAPAVDAAQALAHLIDEHESICFPAWWALPECRRLALTVFHAVQGERLGRVLITRLPPGGRIEPHEDGGSHAAYYERAHLVLQGLPGSMFYCGESELKTESVNMQTGELWWFDNAKTHRVVNNSSQDRVHMIIDYRVSKA